MAKVKFRPDSTGIAQFLKSNEVQSLVHDAAVRVAGAVSEPRATTQVADYTTDRAASAVTIVDGRARVWQVRDGILTRAVAAAGLEMRDR